MGLYDFTINKMVTIPPELGSVYGQQITLDKTGPYKPPQT
jgi:hypothetical protein